MSSEPNEDYSWSGDLEDHSGKVVGTGKAVVRIGPTNSAGGGSESVTKEPTLVKAVMSGPKAQRTLGERAFLEKVARGYVPEAPEWSGPIRSPVPRMILGFGALSTVCLGFALLASPASQHEASDPGLGTKALGSLVITSTNQVPPTPSVAPKPAEQGPKVTPLEPKATAAAAKPRDVLTREEFVRAASQCQATIFVSNQPFDPQRATDGVITTCTRLRSVDFSPAVLKYLKNRLECLSRIGLEGYYPVYGRVVNRNTGRTCS